MNFHPNYLTFEGKKKLEEELHYLTTAARKELAERLNFAIKQGDLSENADYHKAKEDQAFLEGRIKTLEAMLRNIVIVEEARAETSTRDAVHIGCRVTVIEEGLGEPETYMIVGAAEASPKQGKISNESPMGKAILGKRVGEKAVVKAPAGETRFEIVKIE